MIIRMGTGEPVAPGRPLRVLITGGGGFLGSHLADAFLARGDEVLAMDTGSDAKVRHLTAHPRFRFESASVLDEAMLESLVMKCDLVYHLAAVVGVEHYVGDPYKVLDVNVNGTQLVLKLAFKHERKVVFSSTSEVYGKNPAVPFCEDADRVLGSTSIDRWCYSTSKAVGEHFCFAFQKMGLRVTIVRFFNIYGPKLDRLDSGRVLTVFLGQMLRDEPVTLIGDGLQTRCFTYVDDAVRATVQAGLRREADGGIFNIGTDRETTIRELAETMKRITRSRSAIVSVPQERIYGPSYEDIPRRVPDVTRMKTILGVTPSVELGEGLARTIAWFVEQVGRPRSREVAR